MKIKVNASSAGTVGVSVPGLEKPLHFEPGQVRDLLQRLEECLRSPLLGPVVHRSCPVCNVMYSQDQFRFRNQEAFEKGSGRPVERS